MVNIRFIYIIIRLTEYYKLCVPSDQTKQMGKILLDLCLETQGGNRCQMEQTPNVRLSRNPCEFNRSNSPSYSRYSGIPGPSHVIILFL